MISSDVVILGAGAIGTGAAWRCLQRGLTVTLVDPHPDAGAWSTAAGMLAPVSELAYTEPDQLALGLESLARYPGFVTELQDETGLDVGYRETGTVLVGWDAADFAVLRDVNTFAAELGVTTTVVTGRALRELEPALAPGAAGALHAPVDHSVDPRALHAALLAATRRRDVRVVHAEADVLVNDGVAQGVRFADGSSIAAQHVVVAAGSWSGQVRGVPFALPVRPVKGQTLRLRLPSQPLTNVVRGLVRGSPVYVVPRADGRIVVGASSEEAGFDVQPRAGAVHDLLRDAQTLVPELAEAVLEEVCTGLRPATPDNLPIIGSLGVDGLIVASGHFRNGILHTPLTADAVASLVAGEPVPDVLASCLPSRFTAAGRAS